MKSIKRILFGLGAAVPLGVGLLYLTGHRYILRGIRVVYLKGHTSTYIDDWPEFDNRVIESGCSEDKADQDWPLAEDYNTTQPTSRLQKAHKELDTIAFLIVKNNKIWYEDYAENYGKTSKTNSFSIAKSITTALLGKALKEGAIKSLDQPVADFFPEVDERLTIGDLASMASGMKWNEDYDNPFSSVAQLYLDKNIRKYVLSQKIVKTPGKEFDYNSGNTQLLGMVIEKATGERLSAYLSKHFWKPMGMQEDALWQLDGKESNIEKSYCCIASNARDFARFGKLFKDLGKWNGKQLLDTDFVEKCIQPRFKESREYGYGFWLSDYRGKSIFTMRGILGQYVIVIPEDELIIVRLGHKLSKNKDFGSFPEDFYVYIDETYKMLEAN